MLHLRRVTSLINRGRYSFAIPVQKDELKALGIDDPDNQKIQISVMDAKSAPLLIVQPIDQPKMLSTSQALDAFFDKHPEIKDREQYLRAYIEKMK